MTVPQDSHPCYRVGPEAPDIRPTIPLRESSRSRTEKESQSGYGTLLTALQNQNPRSRAQTSRNLYRDLPGSPEEITSLDHRIAQSGGTTSSLDLLPQHLKIQKQGGYVNSAHAIRDLTRQNGYLLAEVALLKETRCALRGLQAKTKEAFLILQSALREVSDNLTSSEQRLMHYWGTHPGDGSEEIRAF